MAICCDHFFYIKLLSSKQLGTSCDDSDDQFTCLWSSQAGALCYQLIAVCEWLYELFGNRAISLCGNIE